MKWSKYNYFYKSDTNGLLLFNLMSRAFLSIPAESEEDIYFLREHPDQYKKFTNFETFIKYKILVENAYDDIAYITNRRLRRRYDGTAAHLTILVSRSCNFNCIYCYEVDRPNINMDDETEQALLNFICSNHSLKTLDVVWFGGEPLMNFHRIKSLTQKFQSLSVKFSAQMITNGSLLSPNICKQLDSLHIRKLQITLDGLAEEHDKRRPFIDGKGSFTTVISNIHNVLRLSNDTKINIRVNLDKNNYHNFGGFYNYLKSNFQTSRLNIYPGFIHDILNSGCSPTELNMTSRSLRSDFYINLYNDHGIRLSSFFPSLSEVTCIANHISGFVIDPEGAVFKCWSTLCKEEFKIGNIRNPSSFRNDIIDRFLCGADYLFDQKCRDCIYFPICGGGCPLNRVLNKYENESYDVCLLMKHRLDKYLELYLLAEKDGHNIDN